MEGDAGSSRREKRIVAFLARENCGKEARRLLKGGRVRAGPRREGARRGGRLG